MKFPFPSFKDWLQALRLLSLIVIWFFLATVIIFGLIGLGALVNSDSVILLSFPVALIVFPIYLFTYTHYLLRGVRNPNRPAWLATYPSWNEGVWQWFIAVTAFLGLLIFIAAISLLNLGLVFLAYSLISKFLGEDGARAFLEGFHRGVRESTNGEWPERLSIFLTILQVFFMALMFRWKRSWEKKLSSKKKGKSTIPQTVAPTVPPITIDDELAKLKAQIEEEKNTP